ncbi:hypothetical protein ZIOFF_067557 [Zingiber officinale]|uniref:Uncharacterized protein n=1 Tax=Zingiber officinale TaxID=94328 RepID=A0A8J5CAQ6_ZINOF|nr:hypothetical protein ZIOFF_067557 [Zingiber officinale]
MAARPAIPSVTPSAGFGISEDAAAAREGDRPSQPEEDFEFTFPTGCTSHEPTVTADELFSHGRVLPIYPVFDRSLVLHRPDEHAANGPGRLGSDCHLLIEESRSSLGSISSSSFDTDDPASVAVRKYCRRTTRSAPQSPDPRRESASAETGRRWRLQDILFGTRTRNQSDSQKKSLFLKFPSSPPSERIPSPSPKPCRNRKAAMGLWRFFLPYRPEIFGRFKAQKRPFH